jgi:C2 domain
MSTHEGNLCSMEWTGKFTKRGESTAPLALEGNLSYRNGDSSNRVTSWTQGRVVFDMRSGGMLACYKKKPGDDSPRRQSKKGVPNTRLSAQVANCNLDVPTIYLPPHANWVVKDITNDARAFVVEIWPEQNQPDSFPEEETRGFGSLKRKLRPSIVPTHGSTKIFERNDLEEAEASKGPLCVYFTCSRSNEKVLWLHAFEEVGRLSYDVHRKVGLKSFIRDIRKALAKSRTRSPMAEVFAKQGEALRAYLSSNEDDDESKESIHDDPGMRIRDEQIGSGKRLTEYIVEPRYAYPNRWMTDRELHAEVVKPSEIFHDLRRSDAPQKEIGLLKVEILQCSGLPALDLASATDAVAYMVCGSYAFTSDVISNKLNPMWLPRSRRACIFPVFHAYARLYVGMFDDDGVSEKDDFAGRVVIDIARFRPRSTYDVTLPLRLSGHVYSRESRGCIRLRLSLEYHSERDALLSYIPKKIPATKLERPDDDVTVLCGDEKAFRNIATTVHGIHMPGRFSFREWKGVMREANFARKVAMNACLELVTSIVKWENPTTSLLLFVAWMHSVYANSVSLVPMYFSLFSFLIMVKNYAFFGSDGPVQKGFVPPSFEEMFVSLIKGGTEPMIQPLNTRAKRTRQPGIQVSARNYKPHENLVFWILGFPKKLPVEDLLPGDYDMEFPFSRGLRNPETGNAHYPKLAVKDSLVVARQKKKKGTDQDCHYGDDGDSVHDDIVTKSYPTSPAKRSGWKVLLRSRSSEAGGSSFDLDEVADHPPSPLQSDVPSQRPQFWSSMSNESLHLSSSVQYVAPKITLPEQDLDAKVPPRKKKKLGDELNELRDNFHKLTFHAFHDRTHRIRNRDAVYYGGIHRGRPDLIAHDLERLLNVGQHSSPNPLVSLVGLYMEPMISAAHSGLGLLRALYNILTWRDPILSFWVSLTLLCSVFFFAIFPWRLFFLVIGWLVLGPQNYLLRVMAARGSTPSFINDYIIKRRNARVTAQTEALQTVKNATLPRNQPIIFSHTSDNSPPKQRDPREVHEVCVPYSQLMYHRTYDWPPEPRYAKCTPNADLERMTQKIQQSRRRRTRSKDSLHSLSASVGSSEDADTGSVGDFG